MGYFECLRTLPPEQTLLAGFLIPEEIYEGFFAFATRTKPQVTLFAR